MIFWLHGGIIYYEFLWSKACGAMHGLIGVGMGKNRKRSANGIWILLIVLLTAAICVGAPILVDLLQVDYYPQLELEAGAALPAAADFLPENERAERKKITFLTDISTVNTNIPGSYPVRLQLEDKLLEAVLVIRDTVAPVAQAQDVTAYDPKAVKPEAFVANVEDVTAVQFAFESAPDLTADGEQQVAVLVTDAGGNTTRLQAKLILALDQQAPQLQGVKDLQTYVGDTVAYRSGVTVTDDKDESPQLEIDSSGVDLSTPGEYSVTYTARDQAGNTTTATAKVTVREKRADHVEPEVIYEKVDAILDKLITGDMTDREKVEVVYCWTRLHFQYGKSSDKEDYLQIAYEFLQTLKGDCASYFSLQKLMLERLGIPTIDVTKVKNYEGDSNHYWLLVSIDKGQTYYHFDNVWSKALCLVTDKTLNTFSKACKNCFNRDESLYPPTPAEELPYSKLPWDDPVILNTLP